MIDVFLHRRARALELYEVDPAKTVEDFGIECAGAGASVWLEGADEPLDPRLTLEAVDVVARCHVHVSSCLSVVVKVRYGGDNVEFKLSPATTAAALLKWAGGPEGFKLTDAEIAKHVLVICGTNTELDQAEHLGFIVDDDCSACLDLLPKERFEG